MERLKGIFLGLYVWAAAMAVRLLMRAVKSLIRFDKVGFENVGDSGILSLWHESYFVAGYANPFDKVAVLTTKGVMGDIVSKAIGQFQVKIIRTSFDGETKRGAYAVLQLIKAAEEGYNLVIVPDGPKGPRRRCKKGIFYIAEKTGKKIIPVGVAASHKLVLGFRWDKYFIPLPFSRVVLFAGEPFEGENDTLQLDAAMERARKKAEELLHA